MKILSDRMLRIKGFAEHSRWTCVDRPSRSANDQLHNNASHRKCLQEKTAACVSLLVFPRIRRGTFPYSVEDDASTISQTPTTHYTNTCVKAVVKRKNSRTPAFQPFIKPVSYFLQKHFHAVQRLYQLGAAICPQTPLLAARADKTGEGDCLNRQSGVPQGACV